MNNNSACVDINECEEDVCIDLFTCTNTVGSFICTKISTLITNTTTEEPITSQKTTSTTSKRSETTTTVQTTTFTTQDEFESRC